MSNVRVMINVIDPEEEDSAYHMWGDESFDWAGLDKVCNYMTGMRKYWRMPVMDIKEKYGTLRVYNGFGFDSLEAIQHPGHVWRKWPRWTWSISHFRPLLYLINRAVVPVHMRVYRHYYKQAIKRWPHLRRAILVCADFPELLRGL
jgi:hypothetical protein